MHRRHHNQSLGVASIDLSGPHVGTPVPGNRTIASSQAHYFLVLSIKLAPKEGDVGDSPAPVQVEQQKVQGEDGDELIPSLVPAAEELPDEEPEVWVKPILYAALLERKNDATQAVKSLLAQIKSEYGHVPETIVYRLHSDMGTEFLNKELREYCL